MHTELFPDTSRPESTCDPSDILHLDTLAESQRGMTDIVVKKFGDDKPDNPRLGFFLKVEVVQLTSDSYDDVQQETFNLSMRLKHKDKQQQSYQHGISMVQTVTYSQASTKILKRAMRYQDSKGIFDHSSSTADPIVEDALLQVHTMAGVGPY